MSTIAQAAAKIQAVARGLDEAANRGARKAALEGKKALVRGQVQVFGADRRPSNWKKGRKTTNARYTIKQSAGVTSGLLYPTGDPVYVFLHGRPRGTYRTRKGHTKHYPAMAPRRQTELWHRPAAEFIKHFPEHIHDAHVAALSRIY